MNKLNIYNISLSITKLFLSLNNSKDSILSGLGGIQLSVWGYWPEYGIMKIKWSSFQMKGPGWS